MNDEQRRDVAAANVRQAASDAHRAGMSRVDIRESVDQAVDALLQEAARVAYSGTKEEQS